MDQALQRRGIVARFFYTAEMWHASCADETRPGLLRSINTTTTVRGFQYQFYEHQLE